MTSTGEAATASVEDLALIAELHGLASADSAPPLDVSPQKRKEMTFAALLGQVARMARRQPVFMVFEDIHWIDPSTRDLLDRTIERMRNWPVLLLATFRPEFQPPWAGQSRVTMLTLARLERRDAAAMVENIAGNRALPADIVHEIAERTDGVPLFVEELTKAVLESGTRGAAALSSVPHPALSVPATLHASLIARLDRLGPVAKDVAQKGAVIGREFSYELLALIADLPEQQLRETLERLTNSGLLFAHGSPPQCTYLFKHALVQDAAYGTLLRSRRQESHARIAAVLEKQFDELPRTQPELLAFHYGHAGNPERSVDYWIIAGNVSERRGASSEAIAHYRAAQQLIQANSSQSIRLREPEIGIKLGNALIQAEGFNSGPARQAFERARSAAAELDLPEEYARAGIGIAPLLSSQSRYSELIDIGEGISSKLLNRLRPQTCVHLWTMLGVANYSIGELRTALEYEMRAMKLDNEIHCTHENPVGGGDPAVVSRSYAGMSSSALGWLEQSRTRSEEAWTIAQAGGHAFSIAWAGLIRLRSLLLLGRYAESLSVGNECFDICDRHGFDARLGSVLVYRGAARFGIGERPQGLAEMSRGVALWQQTSGRLHVTQWISEFVACLLQDGNTDEADHALRDAEEIIDKTEERSHFPEIRRLRGRLCQLRGDSDQAGDYYQRALEWSRPRKAKLFELRAATSLACLWRDQGKRTEARDLLAPVYAWFTEGFDAPDLAEAKALLTELAA